MRRASIIAALALSALAPASSAAADDCMCIAMPDLALLTALGEQSREVGPFFSSDGVLLSSRVLSSRVLSSRFEAERGTGRTELLWCWSPDDPRCSPSSPAPSDAPGLVRDVQSADRVDRTTRWPEIEGGAAPIRRPGVLGGPRDGVRLRVERPPRA